MKVVLTGATGFIGSSIAKSLLEKGYQVYATHRTSSSFEKCSNFIDKINWINTDFQDWKQKIKDINPDQLIHVAWGGIGAKDRNNWDIQIRNFWFSKELFDLAKECGIKKVIGIGSQAEYGVYEFPVNEETVPKPQDAYGATKTLTANYLRNLYEGSQTEWYWVRIFSVFGEGENSEWLMPTVISKLLRNESIHLTHCQQKYNYLYIGDFLSDFMAVVNCLQNRSGIYNLCNKDSIELKELLLQIADIMNISPELLEFGKIRYRDNQNMLIAGDNSKFRAIFLGGLTQSRDLRTGLLNTIDYFKNKES